MWLLPAGSDASIISARAAAGVSPLALASWSEETHRDPLLYPSSPAARRTFQPAASSSSLIHR
jgi:hypothetical protein